MPRTVKKSLTERENSTLLAVCSNPDDLQSLREILEPDHWDVQYASTCDEALSLMRQSNPAVVACESELPDGSWKELFNLATHLLDPPPVVVVSRHADENLWAEVLNLGGYDVIATPFERTEVSRVMQMASRYGRAQVERV